MLKMEEVSKSYQHRGQVVKALDGATIDIAKGDFVSVVGPSGSGKSTLLLMLGGMLSPSSGRSEEHTSELQSHSFISYAVFGLKKKND